MTRLTRFALELPGLTLLAAVVLMVAGLVAAAQLNQELVPDIEFPVATVVTVWPGASSEEVTREIVEPMETALEGIGDVEIVEVIAQASESFAAITVNAEVGTSSEALEDAVTDAIADVDLPESAQDPEVIPLSFEDLPVLLASASAEMNIERLQRLVEDEVVPELEKLDGVSRVTLTGDVERKLFITLDRQQMAETGVTTDDIRNLLQANNLSIPAGSLESDGRSIPIQVRHRIETLDQLRALVLKPAGGQPGQQTRGGPPTGPGQSGGSVVPPTGPFPLPPEVQALGFQTTDDLTPEALRALEEEDPELLRAIASQVIDSLPPGGAAALDPAVIAALPEDVRAELMARAGQGASTSQRPSGATAPTRTSGGAAPGSAQTPEAGSTADPLADLIATVEADQTAIAGNATRLPEPWPTFGASTARDVTPEILAMVLEQDPDIVTSLTTAQILALPAETLRFVPLSVLFALPDDAREEVLRKLAEQSARSSAGSRPLLSTVRQPEPTEGPEDEAGSGDAQDSAADEVVTLSDVASVEIRPEESDVLNRTNLAPSIGIVVAKDKEANTVEVVSAIQERLDELSDADSLRDVDFVIAFEQGSFIEESISGVVREGALGGLFAILVIFIFLNRSVRSTLIIAVSIPLSVLVGFLLMKLQGLTLNMLTLGGMSIAIGRVVDDSIVVLENIYRHVQQGESRLRSVLEGTREVATAITSSTLVAVAVFLPLGLIGGITRQFFLPLALTITYALMASLVVALAVIPVLGQRLLSPDRLPEERETWLQRLYTPSLEFALDHRILTLVLAFAFFVASLLLAFFIPQTFIPEFGPPSVSVSINLPPGTALDRTSEVALEAERVLLDREDVESVQTTVGLQDSTAAFFGEFSGGDPSSASIIASMVEDFDGDLTEVADDLRDDLADIDVTGPVTFAVKTGAGGGGPESTGIELVLASDDEVDLETANALVMDALADPDNWIDEETADQLPNILQFVRSYDELPIVNLTSNLTAARNVVSVQVDPQRALEHGLTTAQVGGAVREAIEGRELGEIEMPRPDLPDDGDGDSATDQGDSAADDGAAEEPDTEAEDSEADQPADGGDESSAADQPAAGDDDSSEADADGGDEDSTADLTDDQATAAESRIYEIVAKYPDDAVGDVEDLRSFLLRTQSGFVPLDEVASVETRPGPVRITRIDGDRAAVLRADTLVEDSFGVRRRALHIIDEIDDMPEGVTVAQGAQSELQTSAFGDMFGAIAISVIIAYLIMVVTFKSLVHPFTILFSLPFAVSGALVALAATQRGFGISTMIGLMMLIGIVFTNAIVLIDLVQQYRAQGMPVRRALIDGGRVRLRPILMTAAATVLALVPLALGFTEGAIIAAELATVVIGGLTTSTLLTLIIIPVVYSIMEDITGGTDIPPEDAPMETAGYPPIPPGSPGGPTTPEWGH